jgi:CPA2 family monovalent cation:H+ antiporter-2
MHGQEFELITTLTVGLTAALALGYITQRLRLSPIVGYLLAGVAVGPATPGIHANRELAEQMAEIGVILLMFGVGLQFHFKELLAVRRVAVPGAVGQSLVATLLGCAVGLAFGWTLTAGIVFGLAISVASTVVLLRVLADNNDLHTPTGHIAVGWLVVEDLFTVLVLVLLPAIVPAPGENTPDVTPGTSAVVIATLMAVAKIGVLVAFVFYIGGRVIPWFLARVARTRSRELFTLTVLVTALGIAVGSAKFFGVSMPLGAFLAGMVVGQSEFSSRAASDALPMRDAFAVLFFVSVGMLFDPVAVVTQPGLALATLAVILLGKPLAAIVIVLLLKYPLNVALSVAVVLGQIGEFSFILATLGRELEVLNDSAHNAMVAAALISISLNPLLYRFTDVLEPRLRKVKFFHWLDNRSRQLGSAGNASAGKVTGGAIVVGYGPVGRTLVRMLQENGITPTIIEMNLDTVHRLQEDGIRAFYGDAHSRETLEEAGIENAIALLLSSAGMHGSSDIIQFARELNPSLRVLARAAYLKEIPALRHAGADVVFTGEGEVALTMTEFLLRQLGATEEQIDRERERIREELFGSPFTMELLLPVPQKRTSEIEKTDGREENSARMTLTDGEADSLCS